MDRLTEPAALPRWNGPLEQLIHALTTDLAGLARGVWVRRQLARGAVVSLSRREDGRRVLMISRPTAPRDPERGRAAWEAEVLVFLDKFGALRWAPMDDLPQMAFFGVHAVIWGAYLEPEL